MNSRFEGRKISGLGIFNLKCLHIIKKEILGRQKQLPGFQKKDLGQKDRFRSNQQIPEAIQNENTQRRNFKQKGKEAKTKKKQIDGRKISL